MEQVWEARSFTWRCDSFWSGFTCMMQREVGEITGGEIQSVGQLGGSIGSSGSLLCAAAFHISGLTGKGSGLQSDFHGPQVLLPSWALPDKKSIMTVLVQRCMSSRLDLLLYIQFHYTQVFF